MLDVISKSEFFDALNDEALETRLTKVTRVIGGMKHIQDAWMLSHVMALRNARVLDVGGGDSRVLKCMDPSNERIILDRLEGKDGGPKDPPPIPGVVNVRGNLGDHVPELEPASFDRIISISVMEHIPEEAYASYWRDHARLLKPDGLGLHAIDAYIGDEPYEWTEKRLDIYTRDIEAAGLRLVGADNIPRPLLFRSWHASNSDHCMWRWNKQAPSLSHIRPTHQCVSLKLVVARNPG